ncbi:hypothetical protein [Aurantiacibacter poecillastricola]|uniref:hypothetical protein n=1 Tax=Aurantiacibacter poecillastricola TaxID=3064385 RepID=UPI00273EF40F|nr:hypothetical protein [Aurantiacibacter sp. 219JJ12-13]MDP5262526.1 hypothetical protein [Aurantiacibacter sp. 219JJ12-13]
MAKWYAVPTTLRMSAGEYRANLTGLNVVFGAVLGFVLAGAEDLTTRDFVYLLVLSSAAVVTILYLGSSSYKLFYTILAVAVTILLPWLVESGGLPAIPKLQPTIATWLAMVVFLELLPRVKEPPEAFQPD